MHKPETWTTAVNPLTGFTLAAFDNVSLHILQNLYFVSTGHELNRQNYVTARLRMNTEKIPESSCSSKYKQTFGSVVDETDS